MSCLSRPSLLHLVNDISTSFFQPTGCNIIKRLCIYGGQVCQVAARDCLIILLA